MKLGSIRSFGAATFLLATATLIPSTAIAADPLLPNAAAWVAIADDNGNKWITGGDPALGVATWPQSSVSEIQFSLVKVGNGPGESLTSVTLQRPRGQYDHPFSLPMGKALTTVLITLRKPAANGQADWFIARLIDPKVTADEVRSSKGATTSTEVLILSFSKVTVSHRTQTAAGYGEYTEVPPQFDIKDTVTLVPQSFSAQGARAGGLSGLKP